MNTKAFCKIFAAVTDIGIYFFLCRALSQLWFASKQIQTSQLIFDFGLVIFFLSAVTYTGSWLMIGERKILLFLKTFTIFDVLPGALGVASVFLF